MERQDRAEMKKRRELSQKLHPRMTGDWAFRHSVAICGRKFLQRRHYEEFHMKKMRQKNLKSVFYQ